jgi:hypothetical protein
MTVPLLSQLKTCVPVFSSLLLTMGSLSVASQISIAPPSPKPQEFARVQIPEGVIGSPTVTVKPPGGAGLYNTYDPSATQVSMEGNKITISVQLADNGFGSPSNGMDMPIGAFPPGTYQVEVVRRSPDGAGQGTVGTAQFTVSARTANDPLWNNTDMWWDPNESGWGLSLIQHGSGIIFGAWFVYDSSGSPTWYVIPYGTWTSPAIEYDGPIFRTTGTYFAISPFNAAAVTRNQVGTARIMFDPTDSTKAGLIFTVDGVTVFKSLRRQGF